MEIKCKHCDAGGPDCLGLGWPMPDLCPDCAPKINACPFCGTWGAVFRLQDEASKIYYIQCAVCTARGPEGQMLEIAEWKWNRRKERRNPDKI
jgi:hypothetical protein